jgi:transcriptional regulator with XRE-family HTH domain
MTTNFIECLRAERNRLGLSQEAFAKLGGVEKNAQFRYEKGERLPDVDYLLKLHAARVDVWYLLTGERLVQGAAQQVGELLAVANELAPPQAAMAFALLNMLKLCGNDGKTGLADADAIWRATRLAVQFLEVDSRGRQVVELAMAGALAAPDA